jgi:hypothetical protein
MSDETVIIAGHTFVSPSACSYGDYGGSGSYGLANIREVLEEFKGFVHETSYSAVRRAAEGSEYVWPETEELIEAVKTGEVKVIHCTGMYNSETVYIREDVGADIIAALADYPVLNEERMTEVEMEWEEEAWTCWLRDELVETLPDDWESLSDFQDEKTIRDQADDLPDEVLRECYRTAMEVTNTYPVAEYSGVHVDVDRIKDVFHDEILKRLDVASTPIADEKQQEIGL